jgi:hypothetical protein
MSVIAADAEYAKGARPGTVHPVAFVFKQVDTGATLRLWDEDLVRLSCCPIPLDPRSGNVLVVYHAAAEASAFHALGWARPAYIVDLHAEFRLLCNGRRPPPEGFGLEGCLAYFGHRHPWEGEKATMQARAWAGGPWHPGERERILDYCESDTQALVDLWPHFTRRMHWPEGA